MSATQILLVEDERLVATALRNELEQFGYQVSGIVSSAVEAVEMAIESRPDLVLMDIHLKGELDGIDAARKIHDRCRIPVIYLSAFSDAATVARASETEAFGYLLKPYEERELQTTIEMALAKHRVERRLEETERWLAAIHNSIDDAVIATDPDNRIRFINFATEALTGWRKEDALGVSVAEICALMEENGPIMLEDFSDRAVCESRTVELPDTARLVSRDGRATPVEGSLSPIYDAHGEFLGIVLTLRNITARLEFERLQRQIDQRLRRAQKIEAVGRLAGGLSRHLDHLLTVILGNTSLALAGFTAETESLKLLQDAEVAAQNAAELVERLRMFSMFSGESSGELKPVNLKLLVPECLNQIKPLLNSRVNLSYKPSAGVWRVAADELLVGQALLELSLNAQDAMPLGGQLTFGLENRTLTEADLADHPEGQVGDSVRLRVTDTGQGIPPENRARIYEPFFTTKEPGSAVGLGLALVQAVVQQHRGWIECHSRVGHGTQFDLYLPRYDAEEPTELEPLSAKRPRGARPAV